MQPATGVRPCGRVPIYQDAMRASGCIKLRAMLSQSARDLLRGNYDRRRSRRRTGEAAMIALVAFYVVVAVVAYGWFYDGEDCPECGSSIIHDDDCTRGGR